ncbi:hypothetical protein BJ170DRAFT_484894 [Xylariales sp. AK1849]|nr:hypothetical protein BJ170DRAFT_484894 [Xylariales sp. AK1849]
MANVTLIDGHVPNYVNPDSQVPVFLGVQISLTLLAAIVVALRLYTRKYIRNVLTIEDWVASASMLLALISTIVSCLSVLGGSGLHYYDIPPTVDKSIASAMSFANQVLYQPILQLTKISILLFYMTSLGKDVKIPCVFLMVLSMLFCIATTIAEFLQCQPAYMLWSGTRPEGFKCIDQTQFFRITGFINLIMDVATLIVPLPVLWKLSAPVKTRAALCGIFSVGFVAIGAEIVRLVIWYRINDGNRQSKDSTWNRVTIVNWSCVEYCAGVICASLPHLKALIAIILPGFFESVLRSSKGESRGLGSKGYRISRPIQPIDARNSQARTLYGSASQISSRDKRTATHLTDNDSDDIILDTIPSGVIWQKSETTVSITPRS